MISPQMLALLQTRKALKQGIRSLVRPRLQSGPPRSFYNIPGIDITCPRYKKFMAGRGPNTCRTLIDWEYLIVKELGASNYYQPGQKISEQQQYLLSPARAAAVQAHAPKELADYLALARHEFFGSRCPVKTNSWIKPGLRLSVRTPQDKLYRLHLQLLQFQLLLQAKKYSRLIDEISTLCRQGNLPDARQLVTLKIMRGRAQYELGNYAAARTDYEAGLAAAEKHYSGVPVTIYWNLTLCAIRTNKLYRALNYLSQIRLHGAQSQSPPRLKTVIKFRAVVETLARWK